MQNIKDERLLVAFGQNLRALRKKKGLSIKHLADLANLEYSQVARIERGVINTTISTVYSIAKTLDIDLHKLFQFEIPVKSKKK